MKKRLLAMILAMVMVCALVPAAMAAEYIVTEIVPLGKYNSVENFSEGLAMVRMGDWETGKLGYIDTTGKEIAPCKYDAAGDFSEGLAAVKLDGKWGFIDKTGKEVVPCTLEYSDVDNLHDGIAVVSVDTGRTEYGRPIYKYGFIDKTGKEVIACKYDGAGDFSEGLAAVMLDGKCGFVDKTGKEVISCKYDGAWSFKEGLAAVILSDKRGFIDKTGKEVVPCKYDGVWDFKEGLARVSLDNKYGFVDTTGKEVVPCKYALAEEFSEGLAGVLDENWKYGFIDTTGKEVIPCQYVGAEPFSEGLAHVRQDGKSGFIDKTGKEVVSTDKYGYVESFSEGLAQVQLDDKSGFIDATGKVVIPCKYSRVGNFHDGFALVWLADGYDEGKVGLIDKTGKEVLTIGKYDVVSPIGQGIAQVMLNGKIGIIAITAVNAASPTNDKLAVDGGAAAPTAYKISGSNYFKLRDVAALLNGSAKQFDVGYDSATKSVTITTGKGYAAQATDLQPAPSGQAEASTSNNAVYIDGVKAELTVYKINGNNYFKLRDLGQKLDFYVGWESGRGMFIETDKGYDPAS